jgi:hypothetical protein
VVVAAAAAAGNKKGFGGDNGLAKRNEVGAPDGDEPLPQEEVNPREKQRGNKKHWCSCRHSTHTYAHIHTTHTHIPHTQHTHTHIIHTQHTHTHTQYTHNTHTHIAHTHTHHTHAHTQEVGKAGLGRRRSWRKSWRKRSWRKSWRRRKRRAA